MGMTIEQFEEWKHVTVYVFISDLEDLAANETSYQHIRWDLSEKSLQTLSNMLSDSLSGRLHCTFEQLKFPAIAYYGETFQHIIGGKWIHSQEANYSRGRPLLGEYAKSGLTQDPYEIIMNVIRGRPNSILQAIEAAKESVLLYQQHRREDNN